MKYLLIIIFLLNPVLASEKAKNLGVLYDALTKIGGKSEAKPKDGNKIEITYQEPNSKLCKRLKRIHSEPGELSNKKDKSCVGVIESMRSKADQFKGATTLFIEFVPVDCAKDILYGIVFNCQHKTN